jgi:hypothetical protein
MQHACAHAASFEEGCVDCVRPGSVQRAVWLRLCVLLAAWPCAVRRVCVARVPMRRLRLGGAEPQDASLRCCRFLLLNLNAATRACAHTSSCGRRPAAACGTLASVRAWHGMAAAPSLCPTHDVSARRCSLWGVIWSLLCAHEILFVGSSPLSAVVAFMLLPSHT